MNKKLTIPKPPLSLVNQILKDSYSTTGVIQWWNRKRSQLQNLTPAEAWDKGMCQEVYDLAISLETGICT